jgi:DNA repair protein RadC
MRHAISHLASGIILIHNHPSGQLKPSRQDIGLTQKLKEGASLFDIKLLDHLIVTDNSYYSFADEGII